MDGRKACSCTFSICDVTWPDGLLYDLLLALFDKSSDRGVARNNRSRCQTGTEISIFLFGPTFTDQHTITLATIISRGGQAQILPILTDDHVSMINTLLNLLEESAGRGNLSKAFGTFSVIKHNGWCTLDILLHCLSSLTLSCTNYKSLPQGEQLHAHIICLGLEQHPALVPKLVRFYSAFGFHRSARMITASSNITNPLPWNQLISSCISNGLYQMALSSYRKMVYEGITPDNFTYPSVLKACGEMLDIPFGRQVHGSITVSCGTWNLFVHNSLISMYGKFAELDVARRLFDDMPERDAVSWNAIISAYASKGVWSEAFKLFETMRKERSEFNIITWNIIAGGCLRIGNYKGTLNLLTEMRSASVQLDHVAMIIALSACSYLGTVKLGKEIHGSAIRNCLTVAENLRNALVTMYSRCKDLKSADLLFQLIEDKSITTWNAMISGYAHLDHTEQAYCIFRDMLNAGIEPNYVTIAGILPLCARVADLQHGKEFHCYIIRREVFKEYLLIWNSLVDMYARSGKVFLAKRVFHSMTRRDEVTYTSLISGYGMQGKGQAALQLFKEMKEKPDDITMVAVLTACSHSGLVTQGISLFETMQVRYGIIPCLEHFACVADLYGRAGLLHKAKELILRMPYRPTSAMWATLLGACYIHGNTGMGEWVAEKLLEMKPDNPGHYVLIANVYAAAGSWDELAKLRMLMRDFGVRKVPGCAWVDVGPGFASFVVGDKSKPYAIELRELLDGLTEIMRNAGYCTREISGAGGEMLQQVS